MVSKLLTSKLLALALTAMAAIVPSVTAAPVAVRFAEAAARGFLIVRDAGAVVAKGELIQAVRGDALESRLTFRFADQSLSDETVVFSQRSVFRLLSYRLVQRGPSFPESLEASLTRDPPTYSARTRSREGKEANSQGALDVPADFANGMLGLLLRNLPAGGSENVQIGPHGPGVALSSPPPTDRYRAARRRWSARPEQRSLASAEIGC